MGGLDRDGAAPAARPRPPSTVPRLLARSAYWVRAIARHPANQGARLTAMARAAQWHLRALGDRRLEARVTVDGRTRLMARPGQFSAVWTIYDGVHEWEELQFCFRFLRPGDHFVDVGANVGVFSTLLGTRIPGLRITAIEPYPPTVEDLRRNLALNDLEVELIECAVGDEAGQIALEVLPRDVLNRVKPDTQSTGQTIAVPVQTLDTLFADRTPNLVKIDVEGFELHVIRGACQLLSRPDPPVLLFEHCGHGAAFGTTPALMRRFLAEHGYGIFLLDGSLSPWTSDELPPTANVVATSDIDAVRGRVTEAHPAAPVAPVRVEVEYLSRSGRRRRPAPAR